MMSKCKSSAMIIALTSVLLTACSEDEREKVFDLIKSSVEVIAEQFMSSEQRLEKQRLKVVEEMARSEIQKEIISNLRRQNKNYTEIVIYSVNVRKNNGYNNPYYKERGFDVGYIADFDAGIETEDFFTETSLTVEGEIRFWFKEGNLNYEVYLPEWRVTNQYRQSTGNGEKVIDTIGRFLSD